MGRQVFSHLQESRAPSGLKVRRETNAITLNVFPFLLLPPALHAEHDIIWCGISLWSVGVSCPSHIPSQLLVGPQPTHWWGRVKVEKTLALCKHCSAITNTSLYYQHCYQHKSKTQPHTSCYEANQLYPSQNQQELSICEVPVNI